MNVIGAKSSWTTIAMNSSCHWCILKYSMKRKTRKKEKTTTVTMKSIEISKASCKYCDPSKKIYLQSADSPANQWMNVNIMDGSACMHASQPAGLIYSSHVMRWHWSQSWDVSYSLTTQTRLFNAISVSSFLLDCSFEMKWNKSFQFLTMLWSFHPRQLY